MSFFIRFCNGPDCTFLFGFDRIRAEFIGCRRVRGTGCKFESSADAELSNSSNGADSADAELSNSSNGADAPAAAFGKTACADFASAGYKIKMNKAEMNQSEMNAAPSGRKKYPWTLKRVLAWVLIAALVSMYLVTFVLSLSSSPAAGTAFRGSRFPSSPGFSSGQSARSSTEHPSPV